MCELSGRAENVVGEPAVTAAMHRMADEIERLRSLTRFQDGVIRIGDTACLASAEAEAIDRVAVAYELLPTQGGEAGFRHPARIAGAADS